MERHAYTSNQKSSPHRIAAVTPTHLGPTRSNHLPATAAASPRNTIATENIQTTELNDQSLAEAPTTPSSRMSAGLKILHA